MGPQVHLPTDDPAVNSRVGARVGGGGTRLARLARWRPLSTLMGRIRFTSKVFVRRAEPNKTGGKSINSELWQQLGNAFPASPISRAGVGSLAALADRMISGGNLP